jgi:fructokinase
LKIISIGELLWDVIDGTEHIGGAPFNFSVHAARLGHEVIFLSAVGRDQRGERALAIASECGVQTRFIQILDGLPTGVVSVQLDAAGQPHFTIHRPAAYDGLNLTDADFEQLSSFQPDWIYFGTLHQAQPQPRAMTAKLRAACPSASRIYDVNLRLNSYTNALVLDLMKSADVVKLNEDELRTSVQMFGSGEMTTEDFCRTYSTRHGWQAVCVTRGEKGCALLIGEDYVEVEAYPVKVADAVGTGDAFAAAFVHGLGNNWHPWQIGDYANRLAALVASRSGAVPPWTVEECERMTRENPARE